MSKGSRSFSPGQKTAAELRSIDLEWMRDLNFWVGLNPMRRVQSGRGKAGDVVRVAAIYADLDYGKSGTKREVDDIISTLAQILGQWPIFVTSSGHGQQPVWAVDRDDSEDVEGLASLYKGWGALVQEVTRRHGGRADSVFDISRILRVPGSINWKNVDAPVVAFAVPTGGAPVSKEALQEAVTEFLPTSVTDLHQGMAPFYGPEGASCAYANAMMRGWRFDSPHERHPWATRAGIKLACLWRLGCLAEGDFELGVQLLILRMTQLCARPGDSRRFRQSEIVGTPSSIIDSALSKVATYTPADMWRTVGTHKHRPAAPQALALKEGVAK